MASSRNNKNKTSGLRILWIPGGKKGHPKGRFDSTNKAISYNTGQKKSEVWSLGGSKTQKSLLEAESDTSLLEGPSISGLATVTGTVAAISAVKVANANSNTNTNDANVVTDIISTPIATPTATSTPTLTLTSTSTSTSNASSSSAFVYTTADALSVTSSNTPITPNTPDSVASTALIASSPNTLEAAAEEEDKKAQTFTVDTNTNVVVDLNNIASIESSIDKQEEQGEKDTVEDNKENTLRITYKMPTKTMAPVIVTTKATTEVIDENRYAILGDKLKIDNIDIYDLPSVQKFDMSEGENSTLNTSSGTTASRANTPSPSISPGSHKSLANTPSKKKVHPKHQNSQVDVNSIESISESKQKLPDCDLNWIDELYAERDTKDKTKKERCDVGSGSATDGGDSLNSKVIALQKKKKKNRTTAKELDQLDGLTGKTHTNGNAKKDEKEEDDDDDDDVVVKCLYYTLMCCDCTIS